MAHNAPGAIADDAWGESCHRPNCDEPLSWDMIAIAFNGTHVYCSPDCANAFLAETTEPIETVTLHDPQYRADRPRGTESVYLWRAVDDRADAVAAVDELAEMVRGPFRA